MERLESSSRNIINPDCLVASSSRPPQGRSMRNFQTCALTRDSAALGSVFGRRLQDAEMPVVLLDVGLS
jgi:hypothetical protein